MNVYLCAVRCGVASHPRRYQAETAAGGAEVKEHLLDDSTDELWAELRHAHIAGVCGHSIWGLSRWW